MDTIRTLIEQLLGSRKSLTTEVLPLSAALDRVVAEDTFAQMDLPGYDESLRDGFVLHRDFAAVADGSNCFSLQGEIAAGQSGDMRLNPQQTCRIMTGAKVPDNCVRVVPQELAAVRGNSVCFSGEALMSGRNFIKPRGCETKKGELVVPGGAVLSAGQLARVAAAGVGSVKVYRVPRICFFCTGKELVAAGKELQAGQKISSNHYLVSALIKKFGGELHDLGLIDDDIGTLRGLLASIDLSACDMVISTGGTGGGKYDLIERALRDSGGEVLCTTLAMRPGKSVVMGRLGRAVFCGLPGPPSAVETLFYEIAGPLLLKLQGVTGLWPEVVHAFLEHDTRVATGDVVQLRTGVYRIASGKCLVRTVQAGELSTCNLILQPRRNSFPAGELVEVHVKSSPFGW